MNSPSVQAPPSSVYGPVRSWRYGRSLGVDLLYRSSICSFNCIYCQLGDIQRHTGERGLFVPTEKVMADLEASDWRRADVVTFSGNGEPTLALNLGECLRGVRARTGKPSIVLTNGILLADPRVRAELCAADRVSVKLDAATEETFRRVNRPVAGMTLAGIVAAAAAFRAEYPGILTLQCMFLPTNIAEARAVAALAAKIRPAEIHLNTPRRPHPDHWVLESRGDHGGTSCRATPLRTISESQARAAADHLRSSVGVPVLAFCDPPGEGG